MKNILLAKNLIIAHRGIHNNLDTPENSLKAIKEAIKSNTPIEIDVQLTKDNQIIVFHDNDLKRMTNTEGLVTNKTLADLKKLKLVNTNESIPTLEEVLKVIKSLADKETTMIIVTHEMAFARDVSSKVIFMDQGVIAEQGDPIEVINNPKSERLQAFLSRTNNN